jgi:hypothetical protein
MQTAHENKERLLLQQVEQQDILYKRLRSELEDLKAEKGSVNGQME